MILAPALSHASTRSRLLAPPVSSPIYPLGVKGKVIGTPYAGTHTAYGNWESDNAIDIAVPKGTPVYAVSNGTIGSQIGAQDSNDPHLQGLRVHLDTGTNSYYYAHLSQLTVKAGQKVTAGQIIGYSGVANGVAHLHIAQKLGDPLSAFQDGTPQAPVPAGDPTQQTTPDTGVTAADLIQQDAAQQPLSSMTPTVGANSINPDSSPNLSPPGIPTYETWQSLASLPGASPDTMRLAQLAGLTNAASG